MILGGFLLLGACLVAGRMIGGNETMVAAAKVFIAISLVAAGVNMWVGVAQTSYSFAEELPIFVLIIALPGPSLELKGLD